MTTEPEVTLTDALAWLKTHTGAYPAKIIEHIESKSIPDGWKLVPVEPTPEMMLHGSNCQHHPWDDKECPMRNSRRSIWKHMCEAAPELNESSARSIVPVKDDDFVLVPRGILGAACSAIDKKRDAPVLLSKLRELSMSAGVMRAAPEVPQ
jgi:hypothetical protein